MSKINFNDKYGLTRAVLELIKDMTRRVIKLPDGRDPDDFHNPIMGIDEKGRLYLTLDCNDGKRYEIYPTYQIGEEVAVAQPYKNIIAAITPTYGSPHAYDHLRSEAGWNNKMFVRTDLMPHRIKITGIKGERMQDISDDDCLREGVEKWIDNSYIVRGIMERGGKCNECFDTAREAFTALINRVSPKIDGKPCWDANPWVFAYEFELIK